jgi:DNA repair exonuclease SbcCD ATPase subunit
MKNLLGLTLATALFFFFFILDIAFSQAQTLPDEIDYAIYHKKYMTLKTDSDQKLANLQAAEDTLNANLEQIQTLVKYRDDLIVEQAQTQQNLQNNRSQQSQLQHTIQSINSQIQALKYNEQNLLNTISGLKTQIDRAMNQMRPIEAQREQTYRTYVSVEAEFNGRKNDEANLVRDIRSIERNMNNSHQSLSHTTQELAQLEAQNNANGVRLNKIAQEIASAEQQTQNKSAQVRSLEGELSTLQTQIGQTTATLNQKRQILQSLENGSAATTTSINKLKAEIQQLTSQIDGLNADIQANREKIVQLKQEKILIPQKIAKANQQIAQLESRIDALKNEITSLRSNLGTLEAEKNQVSAQIRTLTGQAGREAEVEALKVQLRELSKEIAKSNAVISKNESQITEINSSIASERSQISSFNSQLGQIDSKISNLESTNSSKIAQVNQLSSKLQSLNQQLSVLNGDASATLAQINAARAEVNRVENELNQLNQQKNAKSQQLASLRQQIENLTNTIVQLQREERELKQEIAQFNTRRAKFVERINMLRAEIREGENLLAARTRMLQQVQAQINQLSLRLNQLANNLEQMDRDLQARAQHINQLSQQLQSNEQSLAQVRSDLNQAQADLNHTHADHNRARSDESAMLNRLSEIAQDIPLVDRDLQNYRAQTAGLEAKVAQTDQIFQRAQALTMAAKAEYDKRYALFDQYAREAENLAQIDAVIGTGDGKKRGVTDAQASALKTAQTYLAKLSPIDSKYRASVRGEIEGYKLGYDLGMRSSTDMEAGRAQAMKDSNAKAKLEAETVHFPLYKQAKFQAMLAQDLATLPIEVEAKIDQAREFFQAESRVTSSNVKSIKSNKNEEASRDLTQAELDLSLATKTSLDVQINKLQSDLTAILTERAIFADASNAYTPIANSVVAPVAAAVSCAKVYKGLEIFRKRCVENFKQYYVSHFISAHQAEFYQLFSGQFDQVFALKFNDERAKNYMDTKKVVFAQAKSEGELVGRGDIREETYQQTFAENFPVALSREKLRVDELASSLVTKLVSSQAVVALRQEKFALTFDAKLPAAPATQMALHLKIKNLGLKAHQMGMSQLEVVQSRNVELSSSKVLLRDFAAESNIDLLNVLKFKVASNAVPGDDFFLKLRLLTSDGADFGLRVQEFTVTERVRVNPAVSSVLSFEAKPKLRKMIIPGIAHIYPKHQIGVHVKALFAGLSQGYQIELSPVTGDEQKVEMLNATATSKVLRQSESETVYFTYKFKKKARKQNVGFQVLVKYQGDVVRQENFQVTPE